jgi:hypothetical protein
MITIWVLNALLLGIALGLVFERMSGIQVEFRSAVYVEAESKVRVFGIQVQSRTACYAR